MAELTASQGYEHVTVRTLTQTASVSSRTFYGHFACRDECFASALNSVGHDFLRRAAHRRGRGVDQKSKIAVSLDSLLSDFADQPEAARMLLVEAVSAGRQARTQATLLTAGLERLLAHRLAGGPGSANPPKLVIAGIAAGVVRVATTTTLTNRVQELPPLSRALTDWAVDAYCKASAGGSWLPRSRPDRNRRERSPLPAEMSNLADRGDYERALSAAAKLAVAKGFPALTAPAIRREAGVSRRSFDEQFADATECFLAAIESLARLAATRASSWAATHDKGRNLNCRMVMALCAMVARNQRQAQLVLATILAPGRPGFLRRERLISDATEWLLRQRLISGEHDTVYTEATVAASWRIAQREVAADRARLLPRYGPVLCSIFWSGSQI